MKEIPLPLIKVNQAAMVLFVFLSLVFRQPLFIYAIFLIQLIALAAGARTNLLFLVAKWFLGADRLQRSDTQAAELARFNQSIAVILLGISSAAYLLGWHIVAIIIGRTVSRWRRNRCFIIINLNGDGRKMNHSL